MCKQCDRNELIQQEFDNKQGVAASAVDAVVIQPGDGTDLLCMALYQRKPHPKDYLGGSEAKMLYDAANEINRLKRILRTEREGIAEMAKNYDLAFSQIRRIAEAKEAV
jgi:hypothetical protein